MRDFNKKQYLYLMLAGFGAISLSIAFFFAIYRMRGIGEMLQSLSQILAPFIFGGVMAYLLRPMCSTFEAYLDRRLKEKYRKYTDALAIAVSLLTMVLIVYTLIALIVPQVYDSLLKLGNSIPPRVDNLLSWAESVFGEDERVRNLLDTLGTSYEALYTEASTVIRGEIIPRVSSFVSGLGSSVYKVLKAVYNLLIGLIVAIYLLNSRKRFAAQGRLVIYSIFKEKTADAILGEIAFVDRMFGGFIDAKLLDSLIVGLLCYFGGLLLRIPNLLLISVFIGITNFIPFFGPFIGAVPSTLLILMEEPIKALWFVIFIMILQQVDGNIIGPRIMGNRIGISGFWVMFAIIFFGGTFGLIGMVIGVPLFAVIYDLIRKAVRTGLSKNEKRELWDDYAAEFPNEDMIDSASSRKNMQDWTAEDWKTEMLHLAVNTKNDIMFVYEWIRRGAAFVFKWLCIIWSFIKKWFGKLCAAIGKNSVQIWNTLTRLCRQLSVWMRKVISKK